MSERVIEYVILPALLLTVLAVKIWLSLQYRMSIWDAYAYLANAQGFLMGRSPNDPYHFFELLRPPLLPCIIALVWTVTGISYNAAALIQPIFTVASAFVFFLLLKEMFGLKPAFIGSMLLLVAPEIFFWTNQILVHAEVLFFMIIAYYFLWRGVNGKGRYSLQLAGGAVALATLARYTIVLFVPVFILLLLPVLVVSYRNQRRYSWIDVGGMALVFLLVWMPWLAWNYMYTLNPLESVLAGAQFISGSAEPWYFYIANMSALLTIPGCILLLFGLIDGKTIRDKARLFLLLWLVVFFAFSSLIQHKEIRYILDYAPPLVAFATLGVCKIIGRLPSKTKILGWILVVLWLTACFYPAVNNSLSDARYTEASYGSYGEFMTVAGWVVVNTNSTTIGATDIPTALSFQTDRDYYSLEYLTNTAQDRGMTVDQLMSDVGVKYVVVTTISDYAGSFAHDPNVILAKRFPTYLVYTFNCLNCTKRT
ncbi:MAG TPA: glycosyltransferase family 39 protein [Candidatus Bathyarchaeia archaeon]|nr:glycosyltransferase family 39 protein [Candidatus Bathyarchaeia archaeon]